MQKYTQKSLLSMLTSQCKIKNVGFVLDKNFIGFMCWYFNLPKFGLKSVGSLFLLEELVAQLLKSANCFRSRLRTNDVYTLQLAQRASLIFSSIFRVRDRKRGSFRNVFAGVQKSLSSPQRAEDPNAKKNKKPARDILKKLA